MSKTVTLPRKHYVLDAIHDAGEMVTVPDSFVPAPAPGVANPIVLPLPTAPAPVVSVAAAAAAAVAAAAIAVAPPVRYVALRPTYVLDTFLAGGQTVTLPASFVPGSNLMQVA